MDETGSEEEDDDDADDEVFVDDEDECWVATTIEEEEDDAEEDADAIPLPPVDPAAANEEDGRKDESPSEYEDEEVEGVEEAEDCSEQGTLGALKMDGGGLDAPLRKCPALS